MTAHNSPYVTSGKISRPSNSCASSLDTVEQYLGRALDSGAINHLRHAPQEQLWVLAEALQELAGKVDQALTARSVGVREAELPTSWAVDGLVGFEPYLDPGLVLHEYESRSRHDLTLSPFAHHLVLYSRRVLMLDETFAWARSVLLERVVRGQLTDVECARLQAALTRLLAHAPGIRVGAVLTAPTAASLSLSGEELRLQTDPTHHRVLWRDPVLASEVLARHTLADWKFTAQGLDVSSPDDLVNAAYFVLHEQFDNYGDLDDVALAAWWRTVREQRWPGTQESDVQALLDNNALVRHARLIPVASGEMLLRHLEESASAVEGRSQRTASASRSVSLKLPSLSLTFEQVVGLRREEELFTDMQSALAAVAMSVEDSKSDAPAHEYQAAMVDCANDVLRPVVEKLQVKLRNQQIKHLATGGAVAGSVSMGIRALAGLVAGPAGEVAAAGPGAAAGLAAKTAAGKGRASRIENMKVLRNIALSLRSDATPGEPYSWAP